jgi:hypothetical protein
MAIRRAPKTAFGDDATFLIDSINSLLERMVGWLPSEVTYEELVQLFVEPEDQAFCLAAPRKYNVGYRGVPLKCRWPIAGRSDSVPLQFECRDEAAPLLPTTWRAAYARVEAPQGIKDKISRWVEARYRIGADFGRVSTVVKRLNESCTSPRQVRYFLPGVLALCSRHPALQKRAEEIAEFVEPNKIPVLPAPLRRACRLAAGTIAGAQLVDDPPDCKEQVTLVLSPVLVIDEEGFSFPTM